MKIFVKVKTGAKSEKVEEISKNNFKISVKEPAKEGRANRAVIKLLADYFDVSASQITIISGKTSKNKVLDIF